MLHIYKGLFSRVKATDPPLVMRGGIFLLFCVVQSDKESGKVQASFRLNNTVNVLIKTHQDILYRPNK